MAEIDRLKTIVEKLRSEDGWILIPCSIEFLLST